MRPFPGFWRELDQRGVRAAALTYAVVGFVVLLIGDLLAMVAPLPSWLHPLLVKTVLIGLPTTILLAWHFDLRRDIRPVGGRDLDAIDEEERLRARSLRKMAALVVAVLAITFTAGAVRTVRELAPDVEAQRIVVVPLENRTGDPRHDEFGELTAEWVSQRLIQTRQLQVVPAASVTAYRAVQRVRASETRERAIELARGVGAGLVVWGTYHVQNDSLRIHTQVADSRNGDVVRNVAGIALHISMTHAGLTRIGEHISMAIAEHYGARLHTWPPSLRQPPSFDAHAMLRGGYHRYALGDRAGAVQFFERSAALDSTFVLPRVWQARVLAELGELERAGNLALELQQYRGSLTSYDRTMLEHTIARARSNVELSYAASTMLATIAPASDDAVRLLAIDALAMNHPREARGLLDVLNPEQGWLRGWPEYYGYKGVALHMVGNHREELRLGNEGVGRFPNAIEPWLTRCRALAGLRDVKAMREVSDAILRLRATPKLSPGRALLICAQELGAHEEIEAMRALARRSEAWFAARRKLSAEEQTDHALALFLTGKPQRAYATMRNAVEYGRDARATALLRAKLARIAALTGRNEEAAALEREAAALPGELTSPYVTLARAHVAIARGDIRSSFFLLRDAVAEGLPHADPHQPLLHAEYEFARLATRPGFRVFMQPRG